MREWARSRERHERSLSASPCRVDDTHQPHRCAQRRQQLQDSDTPALVPKAPSSPPMASVFRPDFLNGKVLNPTHAHAHSHVLRLPSSPAAALASASESPAPLSCTALALQLWDAECPCSRLLLHSCGYDTARDLIALSVRPRADDCLCPPSAHTLSLTCGVR